jgi:site-specific DNA-methyltransferase (adenine-specific)
LNVSKAIDEAAGAVREIIGVGTNGMGRLNQNNAAAGYRPNPYSDGVDGVPITAPATDEAKQWDGWGTALKPGHEPICLARKPFVGTVAGNVLVHGTGALNIDGCRIAGSSTVRSNHAEMGYHGGNLAEDYVTGSTKGRWPANLLLDEDAAAELDRQADGVSRFFYCTKASRSERDRGLDTLPVLSGGELTDRVEGTAGLKSPRAGAGRTSGGRNTHPTVKPLALMRYLCRLVTPPEGVVLDPFMGSGTTGMAALLEGFRFLGIERESEYLTLAHARIASVLEPTSAA